MAAGLQHGPIPASAIHLCIDMQAMFLPGSPWGTPWMERVLPAVLELSVRRPDRCIFTRFIPATDASTAIGTWCRYWRKWESMTLDAVGPDAVELVVPLRPLAPPARLLDKRVYSPWTEGALDRLLRDDPADTLVVSGGETDICVLSAVLGAVDRGYRVIVAADAVCGSADTTHDAVMTLYASRYGEQIELAPTAEILDAWA